MPEQPQPDDLIPMPAVVQVNQQTLYLMHLQNARRLGALEYAAKDTADSLVDLKVSNTRIESKLDDAIECRKSVDTLRERVNKAEGMGILMTILLTAGEAGAAIWSAIHGKG